MAIEEPEPTAEQAGTGDTGAGEHEDIGQRLEEARRRLRQTIPPPED
jgi:hypothetical protein